MSACDVTVGSPRDRETPIRTRKLGTGGRGIPGFWWTGRIFWKGYHHTLDEADVYDVLPQDSTVKLSNNLAREWEKELYNYKTGGRPKLTRALWRCYRTQILAFTLLIFMEECMRMVQTILMGKFIALFEVSKVQPNFLSSSGSNTDNKTAIVDNTHRHHTIARPDVFILITFIILIYLVSIFLDHNFFHHGYRMRVATTSLIYRKVMRLCSSALKPAMMETIMNLITKEMDVFPLVVLPATYILIGPVQLAVTCYLLWDWLNLGPACVTSLLILFLMFPVQVVMGRLSRILREKLDSLTNVRLRHLQLIMSGLEEMKTSNWADFCVRVIGRTRKSELSQMKKLSRLQAFNSSMTLTSGKAVLMATFVLLVVMGHEINGTQIFTALALLESLRVSMSILLPAGMLALSDTLTTLNRVEKVLLLPEKTSIISRPSTLSVSDDTVIRFKNYFASREKNFDAPMVLVNIDVDIEKNELYCIIGPPDSGKSCLLLAVLGELERHKGQVFHDGKLGYVPAWPWLCPGTIRDNIVFGSEFSHSRYTQVLNSCALNQVVDSFPLRDQTVVGERGLALDPSIQAKITLARAVYQNCDIYLIDDILKGMDAKSAMHIFKKCICGLLRSKTRLVITDNTQHTQIAYKVILMSQCRVHHIGSYDELLECGVNVNKILTSRSYKNVEVSKLADSTSPLIQDLANASMALSLTTNPLTSGSKDSPAGSAFDILQADFKESGDPLISNDGDSNYSGPFHKRSIYTTYFLLGGGFCGIFFFIFTCLLEQGGFVLCEWWLAYWSENYQNVSAVTFTKNSLIGQSATVIDYHIFVYIGIVAATVLLGLLQAILFYAIAQKAGWLLHDLAVGSLLQAPLSFFDANSRGGVLSHFLRDVGIVDSLPPVLLDLIESLSVLLATALIVGCVNYWLFIVIVPLFFLFMWAVKRFYKATQDVERIELASKCAVGAHVVSSMEGIQTLRSLNVEQRFLHKFDVYQDRSTAACYLHLAANRWFGIRVDLIGLALVIGVVLASFLVLEFQGLELPASLVALSLYYSLNLTNVNQPVLRKSAAVHFKMRSVSHLLQYYQLSPEVPLLADVDTPTPPGWPRYGIITCEGVSVPPANGAPAKGGNLLRNIWCCIRAQEKMGMIFCTASEQRAFLSMLFRLTDYVGVVRIDGLDTLTLQKNKLRDKLMYISQNPTLFIGSIRENLDPDQNFTDAQVWKVLEEVRLSTLVLSLDNKLATDISILADGMSVGQRQLLRLASAMLQQSKIVIYEEPSSSLDIMCNTLIQNILRIQFPSSTVLHIAHLPDTIIHTDRIMIFSEGKIAEVDTPYYLLQNPSSRLSCLVAELGSAQAENLRQLALNKHENRPYVAPHIDPEDFQDFAPPLGGDMKAPNNLNVLPTFHSSRLAGVLNQLPTNKFSTDRL
ncbi:multidrug resistance-associated protein 4 [Biomphalaria glabrata]|nr:multidrug resistance-associated protein 4 [Biomphalaria glabrata]